MNKRFYWLLAALLICTGCGRQARQEGTSLVKVLREKQASFKAINSLEKDLYVTARSWCESMISGGAGNGKDLNDNVESAKAMAQSAETVSGQLGQLRQALYDQPLTQEYPEMVRGNLLSLIMKRQKTLQDVRGLLQNLTANFQQFAQTRTYKGDSYPPDIDKLHAKLSTYRGADDIIGQAIEDLKVKYGIEETAASKT